MKEFFKPMRPGLRLKRDHLPAEGWNFQPKVDEERGLFIPYAGLFNRFGEPVASYKVSRFVEAIQEAGKILGDVTLDIGMLGFRGREKVFGNGAILVYDLPGREPWHVRLEKLARLPGLDVLSCQQAERGRAYQLLTYGDGKDLYDRTVNVPGLEGVIGRRESAWYQSGESKEMLKAKWKA